MPERLCEGPVGLGIDLARLDSGLYQVRKLQSGGAAHITGKLQVVWMDVCACVRAACWVCG
jgi:hypothetical protein